MAASYGIEIRSNDGQTVLYQYREGNYPTTVTVTSTGCTIDFGVEGIETYTYSGTKTFAGLATTANATTATYAVGDTFDLPAGSTYYYIVEQGGASMKTIKAGTYKFKDTPTLQTLSNQALQFTCEAERWYFIAVSSSEIVYNNEDADYPHTVYSNGAWDSTYSFRQTITLATDQTVSDEFYTWFDANIQKSLKQSVEQHISDAYDAISNKSGTIPTAKNLANLAGAIDSISSGTDTSDATATAADILKDKTAYVASGKVAGTIETYNGETEDVGGG